MRVLEDRFDGFGSRLWVLDRGLDDGDVVSDVLCRLVHLAQKRVRELVGFLLRPNLQKQKQKQEKEMKQKQKKTQQKKRKEKKQRQEWNQNKKNQSKAIRRIIRKFGLIIRLIMITNSCI